MRAGGSSVLRQGVEDGVGLTKRVPGHHLGSGEFAWGSKVLSRAPNSGGGGGHEA